MAGSNTYDNYRHQSDACHAYQIAKKSGIPESNIILLAYDDIAFSSSNPFPGKIFNKPTDPGVAGVDVYEGCKISYKGANVNAANFLKVLSGDTSAPGPVLKSTAQDHVFVYYADHGGVGILGVPDAEPLTASGELPRGKSGDGYIHAADINTAIETLQSKGGYKELLFYLEACEGGSIFANLLKAPNAKALTSANPSESSWGWYCAPTFSPALGTGSDVVDGKNIGSCLGDEFSVRWMEDTETPMFSVETVGQQAAKLVTSVTKSHVQQYGVTSFDSEPIRDFLGGNGVLTATAKSEPLEGFGVDSRQVEVHQAYIRVMRAGGPEQRKEAEQELAGVLARRHTADDKFGRIASAACEVSNCMAEEMLEGPVEMKNADCHKAALEAVVEQCGSFNDYSLRYSRLFANFCEIGMDQQTMKKAIEKGCGKTVVV